MRVVSVVLLCLCGLVSAATTFENGVILDNSVQHSLSESEYHLTLTGKQEGLSTEDDVAALFHSLSAEQRNVVANTIRDLLESFRDVIIHGTDTVPVLDPLVIDRIGPFLFTTTGVRVEANIRNFRVEGLKWYIVDRVTFQALRLAIGAQITVPWIVVSGDHDARATIGFLTHEAGGNFRVFINRLVVSVDMRLGTSLSGGHLLLRELDIKIDIHDTHIQFNGLFGSSVLNTILNNFVQTITQEVIQNEMGNVSAALSEALFDAVNDVLSQFTLDDLLGNN